MATQKIIVAKRFRDKFDKQTWYEVGDELEFQEDRVTDLVKRGLASPSPSQGGENVTAEAKAEAEAAAQAEQEAAAQVPEEVAEDTASEQIADSKVKKGK